MKKWNKIVKWAILAAVVLCAVCVLVWLWMNRPMTIPTI